MARALCAWAINPRGKTRSVTYGADLELGYLIHSIVFYSILFNSFSSAKPQKPTISGVENLNCADEAEEHRIQVDRCHLTAEERNLPQGNFEPVGATVEHVRKEAPDGHTVHVQEVDSKEAVEEGSTTQEKVLKQKKRPEVSWVKNKGYFTGQRQFYFSGSYGFLKLVRHL